MYMFLRNIKNSGIALLILTVLYILLVNIISISALWSFAIYIWPLTFLKGIFSKNKKELFNLPFKKFKLKKYNYVEMCCLFLVFINTLNKGTSFNLNLSEIIVIIFIYILLFRFLFMNTNLIFINKISRSK